MRDPGRTRLRGLLPGRRRQGRRGVRRSHRGGARGGHHRRRRLVRRRIGLWLPGLPGLRGGLPVRERDGRPALRGCGTGRLPAARGNRAAGPRGVRPEKLMDADSCWLITEDGFTAALANTYETLFTTGNGYLGTRGTLAEGHEG